LKGENILIREDELIKRMEQGDQSAADELMSRYYPEILRYCIWHAPNQGLAEDATQEVFLKAIRYFDHYRHKGKFKAFLYQIARNTCIDMQRKKWLTDVSIEGMVDQFEYVEEGFEAVHENLQLRQMVSSLAKHQQEIIILRYSQELSLREIAQIVDLPLRTVQSQLRSALKKLKKALKGGKNEKFIR